MERKRAAPVTAMQLRRWSSRQVTNSRTRGSAGTPASGARLQQLQVQQISAGKDQEQRQPELQGPQPGPGDPLCRSRLLAKSFFCQGVGTICDVGGWGSRMAAVGTVCWVTPRCWGSEPWVTILRATSSGKHQSWEGWTVWECRVWGVLGSRAAIKAQGPNLGL